MKKKIIMLLEIIVIILIAGFVIWKVMDKNNGEVWITDNEYLYDKAIDYLVKEEEEWFSKNRAGKLENFHVFTQYEDFGISTKGNRKYAYMWVLMESYYLSGDTPESCQGSSMMYRFVFENNEVVDYQTPEDGDRYPSSLEKMLPADIESKVYNYKPDTKAFDQQLIDYYGKFPRI